MRKINGKYAFGFFEGNPYGAVTDTVEVMAKLKNNLDKEKVIKYIETLDVGYLVRLGCNVDLFTGEYFKAGLYRDNNFIFPVDVLRYYRRGDIGLPKEYEDYLNIILKQK